MVHTGIQYLALLPGLVSGVEEREASIYCHYNWRAWGELTWHERAGGVAQYRTHKMVELHQNEAVASAIKKINTKGGTQK